MRIAQLRCSPSVAFFEDRFKKRYGLSGYRSHDEPALFFGCYRDGDVEAIAGHRSLAVVVWCGSDVMVESRVAKIDGLARTARNPIYHIATSRFVARDLGRLRIPYLKRNVSAADPEEFAPVLFGESVYFYGGPSSGARATFYGLDRLEEIRERLPSVRFVVGHTSPPSFPARQMPVVYRECCLGLRLTEHDGCSNTVVELGLMGRRCVWNGDLPNAIPWKSTDCVVAAVEREIEMRGKINVRLAEEVREAICGDDWLFTETYGR